MSAVVLRPKYGSGYVTTDTTRALVTASDETAPYLVTSTVQPASVPTGDAQTDFCPTCLGWGEVSDAEGKTVCPTCLGVGGV